MASKAKCALTHAKRSFQNRYGIRYDEAAHDEIMQQLKEGTSTVVQVQSSSRVVHSVKVKGIKNVVVIYDKNAKRVVTALPPSCNDPAKIGLFTGSILDFLK
jgi:hypothetical protein